mgnify:CR=1 FL=1
MFNMNHKTKYDLAIVYRIYPKVSKTPPIFSDNKLKLSELCLKSFAIALKEIKAKVYVLFDNCPQEYDQMFSQVLKGIDYEFIHFSGIGNAKTFSKQLEILTTQNLSDKVYFAEDDYFYFPNAFKEMINFLDNNKDVEFVTSYDHLDYYNDKFHKIKSEFRDFGNYKWRTVASTCLTFMTSKQNLIDTYDTFYSYTKKNYDAGLWLALTKYRIFGTSIYTESLSRKLLFRVLIKMWFFNWKQIFFKKRWKLWAPVPSLSTHMESNFLSPGFNWNKIFDDFLKK